MEDGAERPEIPTYSKDDLIGKLRNDPHVIDIVSDPTEKFFEEIDESSLNEYELEVLHFIRSPFIIDDFANHVDRSKWRQQMSKEDREEYNHFNKLSVNQLQILLLSLRLMNVENFDQSEILIKKIAITKDIKEKMGLIVNELDPILARALNAPRDVDV